MPWPCEKLALLSRFTSTFQWEEKRRKVEIFFVKSDAFCKWVTDCKRAVYWKKMHSQETVDFYRIILWQIMNAIKKRLTWQHFLVIKFFKVFNFKSGKKSALNPHSQFPTRLKCKQQANNIIITKKVYLHIFLILLCSFPVAVVVAKTRKKFQHALQCEWNLMNVDCW